MRRARNQAAGFTLIEVMIATALLVSIMAGVFWMFRLIILGQERVRDTRDRLHVGQVALSTMARDISMAFLSTHVDIEHRRQTFFDGEHARMDFTTLSHRVSVRGAKESDQAEVGYRLGRHRGYKGSVLLRRLKVPIDDRPGQGGEESVLAIHVKKLEFEYWDAQKEDWDSQWDIDFEDVIGVRLQDKAGLSDEERGLKKTLLPYRVRIRLTLEDPDKKPLVLVTQTPIYMRRSFQFRQVKGSVRGGATRGLGGLGGRGRPAPGLGPL